MHLIYKTINDDDPRRTAKIVMKKTKYASLYMQVRIPMYT